MIIDLYVVGTVTIRNVGDHSPQDSVTFKTQRHIASELDV